jgi:starvation-inducible DNA-binding protein
MDELINKMNELHATTFALYLKSHGFHWNVRGKLFPMYHDFFGDFYDEVYGAVDRTAEEIRALGGYPAAGLAAIHKISRISDAPEGVINADQMLWALYYDNQTVIECLNEVHLLGESLKTYGLINFIEERLDAHKKHAWQLSSSMDIAPVTMVVPTPTAEQVEDSSSATSLNEEVKTYYINSNE